MATRSGRCQIKEAILKEISVLECTWSSPKGSQPSMTTTLHTGGGCQHPNSSHTSLCLLKTAVAQVNVGGIHAEANILFDEGAQRSFMTKKLAKALNISPHDTEHVNILAFGAELSSTSQLGVITINVITLTNEQTNAFHVGLQPVEGSTCSEIWSIESTDATQQPGADAEFLNQYQQSCIRREIHRLGQNPELLHLYEKIILDQDQKGFIERVAESDTTAINNVHYIPHHLVKKASSTTPVRIVYNCSCSQSTHPSLND
ncbi:uncharacterized protein [Dysidea avara]|uniref:uncharacterized protein n=1 Tax=Dysidea avara TaxID=196820 RepID=UPI00332BC273